MFAVKVSSTRRATTAHGNRLSRNHRTRVFGRHEHSKRVTEGERSRGLVIHMSELKVVGLENNAGLPER